MSRIMERVYIFDEDGCQTTVGTVHTLERRGGSMQMSDTNHCIVITVLAAIMT